MDPNADPVETGKMLQKLAYAEPPIDPFGLALAVEVIVITLAALAGIITALRVWVRGFSGRKWFADWGYDDTFSVLAYGAALTSQTFAARATHYGLGTKDEHLNDLLKIRAAELLLYTHTVYGVTMPLIKASVVFMMIKITREAKYRGILYAMLFLSAAMALVGILASLLYCTPVPAYWNPLLGKCGDFMTVVRIGYAWSAVGILTDWTCALLPWFVVRKLQMKSKAKLMVMGILGLGAVASVSTVVRIPYLKFYLIPEDQIYWNAHIVIWSQMESGIGLIAASLPTLRLFVKRYLDTTRGGGSSNNKYLHDNSYAMDNVGGGGVGVKRSHLDEISSPRNKTEISAGGGGGGGGGKWRRLPDDASGKHIILEERTVVVERESRSSEEEEGGYYHASSRR
ncbi:GPCR, PTH11-type [Xylariomycetidae sp. FL2044]|nr:GPCR, PTH11-type [Xylariomycetidae sp. FL2044]